jgi:hypothetical protein
MALETGNYISDLVAANPADTDGKSEGDDHIRLIKKVLKNTFPGLSGSFGGVISLNSARLLVAGDSYQTIICNANMTLPLDAASSLGAGWQIEVWAAGGNVTIDPDGSEQINGASTFGLPRGAHTKIICDGTRFYATQTVPKGIIAQWAGQLADVPSGWAVCDGQNGTPDLRDKFVVGAGNLYNVTQQGGSKDAVVVAHTHTLKVYKVFGQARPMYGERPQTILTQKPQAFLSTVVVFQALMQTFHLTMLYTIL